MASFWGYRFVKFRGVFPQVVLCWKLTFLFDMRKLCSNGFDKGARLKHQLRLDDPFLGEFYVEVEVFGKFGYFREIKVRKS